MGVVVYHLGLPVIDFRYLGVEEVLDLETDTPAVGPVTGGGVDDHLGGAARPVRQVARTEGAHSGGGMAAGS